ncbi:MAG: antibiotic biosynthesis monooxygenase [Candidatus Eremiobacteraeota bacterium]|nr:antibiotic biosynthesis monooxygenase [Candidatus Eremiobacteraeota bacterium]
MFAITVRYLIRAGHEDEAASHFRACLQPSRAEPGNRSYDIYRSLEEPRRFILVERYEDEAAFETHRSTAHFLTHIKNGIMTVMETRDAERCQALEQP